MAVQRHWKYIWLLVIGGNLFIVALVFTGSHDAPHVENNPVATNLPPLQSTNSGAVSIPQK